MIVNTQYMHILHFHLKVKKPTTIQKVVSKLNDIDLEDEYDEEVDFQSGSSRQSNQPKPFRKTAPPEIDLDSLFEDD